MIVAIDARLSHLPAHGPDVVTAISLLERSQEKHTWLVPDPESWSSEPPFEGVPWLKELFQKASTAAVNKPAGDLWASLESDVDVGVPGWSDPFARVKPPRQWPHWLAEPLYVVVEDAERDASFIRCVAATYDRRRLLEAHENRWLEFRHGGGDGILAEAKRLAAAPYRRRIVVLADSDRLSPGGAHRHVKLSEFCQGPQAQPKPAAEQIALWILARRAIENYMPLSMIREYVADVHDRFKRTPAEQARLTRLLSLWEVDFTDDQRAHFHMKKALNPKLLPADLAQEQGLLAGLLAVQANGPTLQGGFGVRLQSCWGASGSSGVPAAEFDVMPGVRQELLGLCAMIESLL